MRPFRPFPFVLIAAAAFSLLLACGAPEEMTDASSSLDAGLVDVAVGSDATTESDADTNHDARSGQDTDTPNDAAAGHDTTTTGDGGTAQPSSLTLEGAGFQPHEGQALTAGLFLPDSTLVAGPDHATISNGTFMITWPGVVEAGISYELRYYADHNDNQACNSPPTDHSWLTEYTGSGMDETVVVYHTVNFVDVCDGF